MDPTPFAALRRESQRAGILEGVLAWFAWFAANAWARRVIIAINLGGIAYGFWYYRYQFAVTPWYYWPLVPDSPLAVVWGTLALVLIGANRRSPLLDGLAFVGNVEVGLWTAFVLAYYDRVRLPRLDFYLFWLHLAMVAQALIYVKGLRDGPRRAAWIAVAGSGAWYGINVVMDYWFTGFAFQGCAGLHPISIHSLRDPCAGLDVVGWVTLGLTVLAVGALAAMTLLGKRGQTRA